MFKDMLPQSEKTTTTQSRKYFGMTTTQMGILAGLAGIACLLFAVAGLLVLRGGLGGPPPAPQSTPTPAYTVTPFALPTLTPTPTLTPVPYEMLIPEGWAQFKTPLIEIWLPKGYKKVNPSLIIQKKADDPIAIELALQDTANSKTSLYRSVAAVLYEPLTADSLDAFLDRELPKLTTEGNVTQRQKTYVNSVEATKIIIESRINNVDGITLVYVFLDGGTVWYVEYAAQINQFFEMVDTFEKSVKTFRIVR